jgi:hypothetical protein
MRQDIELREKQREAARMLTNLQDATKNNRWTEEQYKENYTRLIQESEAAMQKTVQIVKQAIGRVNNWNGSSAIVEAPEAHKDSDWLNPLNGDSASIHLNHSENTTGYDVEFSYFTVDGKTEIDDDLDAGDEEFFTCHKLQEDYFNLINELKKPGSTSGSGKNIWVYTARPVKDRAIYQKAEEAKEIPANLFVTTSEQNAIDLIQDLAGSDKSRDVWKIKINTKYLIDKGNYGSYRHYQTKGNTTVPIVSIHLVYSTDWT